MVEMVPKNVSLPQCLGRVNEVAMVSQRSTY